MIDSVRHRLSLWYMSVLLLALLIFGFSVYVLLSRSLHQRFQDGLRKSVEAAAILLTRKLNEQPNTAAAANIVLDEDEILDPQDAVSFYDGQGKVLVEKVVQNHLHASLPPPESIPQNDVYVETYRIPFLFAAENNQRVIAARRVPLGNSPAGSIYIVISRPLIEVTDELNIIARVLILMTLATLTLAFGGGWFLARRSLRPVVEMAERARWISAENLEQRLPVNNPRDELGQLAQTFNELLSRLNTTFIQQRQFMADASHELRTPLSVIRTAASVTLELTHRDESEYREALTLIKEQAARLSRIVQDMFTLARADTGRRILNRTSFYLDELLEETARAAGILAIQKGITIKVNDADEAPLSGDEGLLRQMLLNLLDNALKFTPSGGRIEINLEKYDSFYQITVTDTGCGIPLESQSLIFERFFRIDKVRSRSASFDDSAGGGAGLGLAIARWVAEAHQGRLELLQSDENGSTFIALLPFAA